MRLHLVPLHQLGDHHDHLHLQHDHVHHNRYGPPLQHYHDHVHLEHDQHELVHLKHEQSEQVHLEHDQHDHKFSKLHLLLDHHVPEVFERVRPENVLVSIQIFRITFPSYYLGD